MSLGADRVRRTRKSSYFERLFLHGSALTDPVAKGLGARRRGSRSRKGEGQGPVQNGDGGLARGRFKLQPSTLDAIMSPHPCPHSCTEDGRTAHLGRFPRQTLYLTSRQRHRSKHRQECHALTDGSGGGGEGSAWGSLGGGLTCPGGGPTTQALAHPLASPELHARSDADCFRLLMQALRHSREML